MDKLLIKTRFEHLDKMNAITADQASIPGGESLIAQSYAQTVIGSFNLAQGTSLFNANYRDATHENDRLFIIGNGYDPTFTSQTPTRSNAFTVSNNGHATVYQTNESDHIVTAMGIPANFPKSGMRGTTFKDNIVYGWAHIGATTGAPVVDVAANFAAVPPTPAKSQSFGISKITHIPGSGIYDLSVDITDEDGNLTAGINNITLESASIVVTLVSGEDDGSGDDCLFPLVVPVTLVGTQNKFTVKLKKASDCLHFRDHGFMVTVVGRAR